ncbi:hypothetical protein BME13_10310 [Klebsiella pneumoniae]|uniref:hypothetical protein n=2 Tax=Klebsiella TaxID=570 RepID=UPI0005912816|nr:hypothetical protein [Klebsiella pneumoniae]KKJ36235.1 hypothetical protein T653_06955 [Klebsiella pneumoniae MRSN 3852]MDU4387837.1 hypothetical protein [Klebsiella michiganensis]EIX9086973.1 hypothetical protein [Klebsiella pneumoniae]EIX9685237.1 hypothetical protein [Klebsiella pneumoniae]MBV5357107.1 hypothetical protein [Klebsiella pneumoniae]
MIKVKVFHTDECLMRDLALSKVNSKSYNDNDGFGFVIHDDFTDYCKVQYVEKNTIERQIETPIGDFSTIQEVTYYKFFFILRYNSNNSIIFLNPPRNIKYASDIIRSLIPEGCHVSQLKLDLKEIIENIKHIRKGKLKSATLSNILYDTQTHAKTKLNSTDDLYHFYTKNYMKTIAKVDSAIFEINGKLYELTESGRITFQGDDIESVLNFL